MNWEAKLARILGMIVMVYLTGVPARAETAGPLRGVFVLENEIQTRDSHVTLAWKLAQGSPAEGVIFELQQASEVDFLVPEVRYQGSDQASYLAGLPEGDHYFRVRAGTPDGREGPWSEPLRVTVTYHSFKLALLLFGIGAVVFAATCLLILCGSLRSSREEQSAA